jgi:hypothetical protein
MDSRQVNWLTTIDFSVGSLRRESSCEKLNNLSF